MMSRCMLWKWVLNGTLLYHKYFFKIQLVPLAWNTLYTSLFLSLPSLLLILSLLELPHHPISLCSRFIRQRFRPSLFAALFPSFSLFFLPPPPSPCFSFFRSRTVAVVTVSHRCPFLSSLLLHSPRLVRARRRDPCPVSTYGFSGWENSRRSLTIRDRDLTNG